MANPYQGEVSFDADGESYKFKLGTYALAVLERKVKMPSGKFFRRADDEWGADDLLQVFYAGLYRQHKLTEEAVGDLIDKIGAERASEIMLEAIGVANAKEVAAGKEVAVGKEDPQTAKANGTGTAS